MEKNYLSSVVWVVLAVVITLLGLYWLPSCEVGDWSMRKVDMLADLRNDSAMALLSHTDSVAGKSDRAKAAIPAPEVFLEGSHLTTDSHGNVVTVEDSIINAVADLTASRTGVTSIIDLSGGANGGMSAFYQALAQAQGRPVRIAVLGDSFIEGDILTSKLRELLQQHFGGRGAGYVPMESTTAGFRRTIRQTFGGWTAHRAVDSQGYVGTYSNITGCYFNASAGAWINLSGADSPYPHTTSCTSSSFYYVGGTGAGYATAIVNGTDTTHFSLTSGSTVGYAEVKGDIRSVRWSIRNPGNMVFLGASMDSETGVIVDNFAMRSASGWHLKSIQPTMMSGFHQARPYDLVIVMYGLNVAGNRNSEYNNYCNMLMGAINNLKEGMPGASILIVGCSDRETRSGDGFHTMKGVLGLIQAQKRVAINCNVAFWNLYEAMGGEGSIVTMVNNGEANRDYTHINMKGGDRIAKYLYDALLLGFENR